jgi:fatty acid-binding protein DegV
VPPSPTASHYLPRDPADKVAIHQVGLYVARPGERRRELELDGFDSFYERLTEDPESARHLQPSIGDLLAVWEPLLEAGQEIASIHISSGISGTFGTARQAEVILRGRGVADASG